MAADEDKMEKNKFEITFERRSRGHISLNQARALAMRTAEEASGDYGTVYAEVPMVFRLVEAEETEDHYLITIAFLPQGEFAGRPGREQFFIEKAGIMAHRQVLALPRRRRPVPFGPVGIGFAATMAVAAVALGIALAGVTLRGGPDSMASPLPAILATAAPAPAPTAAPVAVQVVQPAASVATKPVCVPASTPGPSLHNWPWWRPASDAAPLTPEPAPQGTPQCR